MRIRDTGLEFGLITVINHWIGAAIMLTFLVLMTSAMRNVEPGRAVDLLVATGAYTSVLSLFRLIWRYRHWHPMPLGGVSPVQVLAARGVAIGLLVGGIVLPILCWLSLSLAGQQLTTFFGTVPALMSPSPGTASVVAAITWCGIVCWSAGFLLHVYGAFQHQFVLKDGAIRRLTGQFVEP